MYIIETMARKQNIYKVTEDGLIGICGDMAHKTWLWKYVVLDCRQTRRLNKRLKGGVIHTWRVLTDEEAFLEMI